MTQPEAVPHPDPFEASEPSYEEARETERRARFSLVGPARRGNDQTEADNAPPLSAPHVGEEAPAQADQSDDRP